MEKRTFAREDSACDVRGLRFGRRLNRTSGLVSINSQIYTNINVSFSYVSLIFPNIIMKVDTIHFDKFVVFGNVVAISMFEINISHR